ncbi:uncharacterized protein LOC111643060 [Copidosoma floridanum]|uniref:uncharacterized protein LOC111643060 n=1 Tax=Copidosoma floridanum TaxID=29053 RepID=UPI000C6FAD30|nr:uncharacterized protein LOC111643060 [Copidosoma floridanum]
MGAFIKCCAVHTPSSNPKKPPARHLSETLRRPMNTLRRMRHPYTNRGDGEARSIPSRPGHVFNESQGLSHSHCEGRRSQYFSKGYRSIPTASAPSDSYNGSVIAASQSNSGQARVSCSSGLEHNHHPELYASAYLTGRSGRNLSNQMRHHNI